MHGIVGRLKSKKGRNLFDNLDWHDMDLEGTCGDQGLFTDAVNQPGDASRIAMNCFYCFRRKYRVRLRLCAGKIKTACNIMVSLLRGKWLQSAANCDALL